MVRENSYVKVVRDAVAWARGELIPLYQSGGEWVEALERFKARHGLEWKYTSGWWSVEGDVYHVEDVIRFYRGKRLLFTLVVRFTVHGDGEVEVREAYIKTRTGTIYLYPEHVEA